MRKSLLACLPFVIAACGADPSGTDDFSSLAAADAKADSFSKKLKLVGALSYGDQAEATYHNPPRYVAFTFQASGGDQIDVTVDANGQTPDAWITDGKFNTLAKAYGTSSVVDVTTTLAAKDSGTHYIIVREDSLADATFTVHLEGKPSKSYDSCKADSDCVAISKGGCCPNGWNVAVNKGQAKAYENAHQCVGQTGPCPLYVVDDTRQPECDTTAHKCVLIPIDMIRCGGFTANAHACPSGYDCQHAGNPDAPGSCVQHKQCVQNVQCVTGSHFDTTACSCVPN